MKWFLHIINVLGMETDSTDYREDALNLIANLPLAVAGIPPALRLGRANRTKPELGYIENFVHMLAFQASTKPAPIS